MINDLANMEKMKGEKKMSKKMVAILLSMVMLLILAAGCGGSEPAKPQAATQPQAAAQTKFPERTVNLAVWASAGGGTDQVNRLMGALMEKDLGGKIQVSNMTGGMGELLTPIWVKSTPISWAVQNL